MKLCIFSILVLAVGVSRALDPGGVSIDFAEIQLESSKVKGENMVRQGGFEESDINLGTLKELSKYRWRGNFYVHSKEKAEQELKPQLAALAVRRIVTDNPAVGKQCVMLESPLTMQKLQDNKGRPQISNRIAQWVAVEPVEHPVKYRVSMKLRGKFEKASGNNGFTVFAECQDSRIMRNSKVLAMTRQRLSVSVAWEEQSFEFIAPSKTATVILSLALYGLGQVYIDNVRMVPVESETGVIAKLFPSSLMDKRFGVAPGQPGSLVFVLKNESGVKIDQLRLQLNLPKGFKIIDTVKGMPLLSETVNADGYTSTLIDISVLKNVIHKDRYNPWNTAAALLETSRQPGETLYPGSYRIIDGDYQGPPETFQLQVMKPVQASAPKRFRSAGMLATEWNYEAAGVKPLSEFYRDAGFNSIHGGSATFSKAFKQLGIERYTQPFYSCNGYRLGVEKKPSEVQFLLMDGTPYRYRGNFHLCPVEVYREGEYFKNSIIPMYEEILVENDTADQIMPNWELHSFDFKGCFCERCRDEFIQFTAGKLNPDEVKARWAKDIIANYRTEWIKFRSHQHALLVETLERTINRIGKQIGKDSHFIPEVAWSSMIEESRDAYAQYDVVDYMDKLPWLEPWGPYIFHKASQPYEYFPGIHLITFLAARDVQDFVSTNLKPGARRPKLIAFPHGLQLEDWLTVPESISFEFISFFLNGWNGAFSYRFPRGYDHRYWEAISQANRVIAEFEDYVFDGGNISEKVKVTSITPMPKPILPIYWSEGGNFVQKIKGLNSAAILQWRAFENQGKYLVAVGNFWQKGEVFFSVRLDGLIPSAYYSVHLNRKYQGDFSGSQLGSGILAHAGALRWSFLVIEPQRKDAHGSAFSQEQMRSEMERRSPAIQKAMQWELEYAASRQAATSQKKPHNDFSMIYPIENSEASLKAVKENDRDYLEVKSSRYRALIEPAVGGRIAEWLTSDTALMAQDGKFSMALDGFWWPRQAATRLTSGYKISNLQAVGNGVEITLERTISQCDNTYLAGLKITKKYLCSVNGITVITRIDNPTDKLIDFSFRYHNLPSFLGTSVGKSGTATFGDGQSFTRDLIVKFYRFAAPDSDLEKAFSMDKIFQTTSTKVTFSAPWTSCKVMAEAPADLLQSFIFWDSGKQLSSTFEPLFRKTKLEPGKQIAYQLQWSVE